ncbi:EAL domain-containing protein [Rhodocyclus tenuis]|uniref:sensor domain-containing protein n=1 Tax=Rhodocyclus gracilis TaxID=2929842 RepID=UPI001298C2D3|nr:EAL domain-containing protein [Rhodocyclus gracilis]MRD73425.1 EAL domain-containing protein [Rhodocyclus gracilis]
MTSALPGSPLPPRAAATRIDDEELLRAVLNCLPLRVFVKDRDSTYLFFNRKMAEDLGVAPEALIGRNDLDFFPAELALRYREDDRHVREEKLTLSYEEPFRTHDGEGWILTTKTPWYTADGEVGGILGFFADITPHKRAEARYGTIIQTSRDAFVIVGSEGELCDVNEACCQLVGYTRDELLGMHLSEIEGQQGPAEIAENMQRLSRDGGGFFETQWRHRDGHRIAVEVSVRLLDDGGGMRFFAFVHDISARQRIELALAHKTAIYAMLSRINGAIVKLTDRQALFTEVCDIATRYGGFVLAWIGEEAKGRSENGRVHVLACSGDAKHQSYLETLVIHTSPDLATGRGATGTAIREGRPVIMEHLQTRDESEPWHAEMRRCGLRSSMALPIGGGSFRGAFTVYAEEESYFDEDVVALLEEVAGDISFALAKMADTEQRLYAESQVALYAQVFGNSSDGMIITDAANNIVAVNASFVDITGYTAAEVLGQNPRLLKSDRHGRQFYQDLWATLSAQGAWQGELWNRRKNGDIYPAWVTINLVRDTAGRVSNHFAVFSDLMQKKAAEELHRLKRFDALTGLPNQLMMEDRVGEAIIHATQHDRHVGVLFINLDHFHMVNDLFGHVAGDQVLNQSARRLLDVVGAQGTVSRFSGDFFVVALPDLNAASAINPVASALLASIAEPYAVSGQLINLSARIGIAVFPNDGKDFATLMKNADSALLNAKVGGKNSFRFFTKRMNEHSQRLLTIGDDLRRAVAERWLTLHYQPQVDLGSGKVVGVEALIRIDHPQRGLIPPGEFISVAEENGMIFTLGEWALDEACRQRRRWLDAGFDDFVVAVNVSAHQMARGDLPEIVARTLAGHRLDGRYLELEFTESSLMRNVGKSLSLMQQFHAMGVRLSIDDFGTGYSSLAYLKQFPLDKLKIDQSFVRHLDEQGSDALIVQAILALSHALGLTSIAEGVESLAQQNILRELGCCEMQGYLFSRPLTAAAVESLLPRRT